MKINPPNIKKLKLYSHSNEFQKPIKIYDKYLTMKSDATKDLNRHDK